MAKAKRSSADLDKELAELEAKLASLGQRKPAAPKPAPTAAPAEPTEPAKTPPEAPPSAPAFDLSRWRQEDGAWVRTVPHDATVVRRVLDENGNVVREEPATMRDLEDETPVKAERGIGKLFRRKFK